MNGLQEWASEGDSWEAGRRITNLIGESEAYRVWTKEQYDEWWSTVDKDLTVTFTVTNKESGEVVNTITETFDARGTYWTVGIVNEYVSIPF